MYDVSSSPSTGSEEEGKLQAETLMPSILPIHSMPLFLTMQTRDVQSVLSAVRTGTNATHANELVIPGVIPNRAVLEPPHWEEQLYKRAASLTNLKSSGLQAGAPSRLRVFSGTANPVSMRFT